ncbi:hypothetical protein [Metabacillus iocasae]|uniref:Uncharacterized membrane protein (DUF106 family) n=1 Tax=Priestia iocasae TaxID=2291674 RepID=A0ABS2QTG8_9BACI|nr:hypothetical protein [Metabacillus iocasae]MBM7702774.1 uncharacterized membrane protein (DUF106 family) [Metabacillus iocasae]
MSHKKQEPKNGSMVTNLEEMKEHGKVMEHLQKERQEEREKSHENKEKDQKKISKKR